MNNPILNSESFDRAVYALKHSLENFGTGDFDQSVQQFGRHVQDFTTAIDRMAKIAGMQAANSQYPENQPYSDKDFFEL